jgi:hypothetical protein
MKIIKRIIQGIGILVLAGVLFLLFIKVFGFFKLKAFYDNSTREFKIPGLFENFIPQGMDFDETKETFIISGYDSKGDKSTIYTVDNEKNVKKIYLKNLQKEECKDLCGGVTIYKDYLLVSGGNGASTDLQFVYTFKLDDLYSLNDGSFIESMAETEVYVGTAFINAVGDTLYVGEFNHDGSPLYDVIKTTGRSWMPSDSKAIMLAYDLNIDGTFGLVPTKAYSIPSDVQGMAIVDGNKIAFSDSYGINPGHISFYNNPTASGSVTIDGNNIPLYYFNDSNFIKKVDTSPMIEAICYAYNKIYTLNESASNKYLYGLLYRGSYVYSFDYTKIL